MSILRSYRIDEDTDALIKELAKQEDRSRNNLVNILLKEALLARKRQPRKGRGL